MGIKVASNVKYKGRKMVRLTMKDGTEHFIGNTEAEQLGYLLLAATGEVVTETENVQDLVEQAMKTNEKRTVVRQDWEESERGWGVRPDGYTLHLTVEDCEKFKAKFWADEAKRNPSGIAPSDYTRESGSPHAVSVDSTKFAKLNTPEAKKRYGVWFRDNE